MPVQIRRLLIAFAFFIGLMLVLKYFLTPESWREYGPYRGNALVEISSNEIRFVQTETCAMCHDSIAGLKEQSAHKSIECEICHSVGNKHAEEPELNDLDINKDRQFCLRCHTKNLASPKDIIKQVDAIEHYEGEECITCHNPHQP